MQLLEFLSIKVIFNKKKFTVIWLETDNWLCFLKKESLWPQLVSTTPFWSDSTVTFIKHTVTEITTENGWHTKAKYVKANENIKFNREMRHQSIEGVDQRLVAQINPGKNK